MEEAEEYQSGSASEALVPVEQATILFYGRPLLVVRLPDGRPGVVLRSLTDNLQLDRIGQIRRIQRTEAIADDLIPNVRVETEGGPQRVHVLAIRSVAYWLATIDAKRVRDEARADILRYQREAVEVLYAWAQSRARMPQAREGVSTTAGALLAPPIEEPEQGATHAERATYHELMSVWHRHQADLHMQAWRAEVAARIEDQEARLEAKESLVNLVPEIIERLGPQTITPQHQGMVRGYVKRLCELTGKHYQTIYDDIRLAFGPARYQDLLEDDWPKIEAWFKLQIERASRKKPGR